MTWVWINDDEHLNYLFNFRKALRNAEKDKNRLHICSQDGKMERADSDIWSNSDPLYRNH